MIKTIDAIMAINPNAKVRVFEKDGVKEIEWLEDTTEISETDIEEKLLELNEQEKANKVNGNQKLLDLGLTQEEATALTGYKPD
jgi:hypothetical protein